MRRQKVRGVPLPACLVARKIAAGRIDAYAWELVHETAGPIGEVKVTWNDERLGVVGDRWAFFPDNFHEANGTRDTESADPQVVFAAAVAYAQRKGNLAMRATIYINERHLGVDATPEQARRLVEVFRERGYEEVRYGFGPPWTFDPAEDGAAEERDAETIRAAFECVFESVLAEVLA